MKRLVNTKKVAYLNQTSDDYVFFDKGVIEKLKAQANFAKVSNEKKVMSTAKIAQIMKVI